MGKTDTNSIEIQLNVDCLERTFNNQISYQFIVNYCEMMTNRCGGNLTENFIKDKSSLEEGLQIVGLKSSTNYRLSIGVNNAAFSSTFAKTTAIDYDFLLYSIALIGVIVCVAFSSFFIYSKKKIQKWNDIEVIMPIVVEPEEPECNGITDDMETPLINCTETLGALDSMRTINSDSGNYLCNPILVGNGVAKHRNYPILTNPTKMNGSIPFDGTCSPIPDEIANHSQNSSVNTVESLREESRTLARSLGNFKFYYDYRNRNSVANFILRKSHCFNGK